MESKFKPCNNCLPHIKRQEKINRTLIRENEKLKIIVDKLQRKVEKLEEMLRINSGNSSKPPSTDPPWAKKSEKKKKTKSKKKRGGQPGHTKHERTMVPEDQLDEIVDCIPGHCHKCGKELFGDDSDPRRHQVADIPPVKPTYIEYRLHQLTCPHCQTSTRADLPDDVPKGNYMPSVAALVALMTGAFRLSKRETRQAMLDMFGLYISLGMVSKLEQQVRKALDDPFEEALEYTRRQPVKHADETGWKENRQKAWLWTVVTQMVHVFSICGKRNSDVAKKLLGEEMTGFLCSDRYSAYGWIPPQQRQVCWAHLLRDFEAIFERGGESEEVGNHLLGYATEMFMLWNSHQDGELSRKSFQKKAKTIERETVRWLERGAECEHPKTAGTCKKILTLKESLWTFVRHEGIEPTNNAAERAIRKPVLWRKGSFGSDSKRGSRFVERILTAVATLRRQDRNLLGYLTQSCYNLLHKKPAPSLLPE